MEIAKINGYEIRSSSGSTKLENIKATPPASKSTIQSLALAVFSKVANRSIIYKGFIPNSGTRQEYDELVQLGSGPEFSFLLQKACPLLAEVLEPLLRDHAGLSLSSHLLQHVLEGMIPKVVLNIAKQARDRCGEKEDKSTGILAEISELLTQIISTHCVRIQRRLEEIKNYPEAKRAQKQRELFVPLAEELVTLMFPKGVRELPFPWGVRSLVWRNIKAQAPAIAETLYFQFTAPFNEKQKELLNQYEGGALLNSVGECTAEKCAKLMPYLLRRQDGKRSPFNDMLSRRIIAFLSPKTPRYKRLIDWMALQLEQMGHNQNSELVRFWDFLGRYVSPLVTHACLNVIERDEGAQNRNAVMSVCGGLLNEVNHFWTEHGTEIFSYGRGLQVSDDALALKFETLVQRLTIVLGIDSKEKLPLPLMFQQLGFAVMMSVLPRLIADYYLTQAKVRKEPRDLHIALRNLLFDRRWLNDDKVPKETCAELVLEKTPPEKIHEEFYHKLWTKSGTHEAARMLESTIQNLVADTTKSIWKALELPSHETTTFLYTFHGMLVQNIEMVTKRLMLNAMTSTASLEPSTPEQHPRYLMLFDVILRFMGFVYENTTTSLDKAFYRISDRCHQMLSPSPIDHIPLDGLPGADEAKLALWTLVRTVIIPLTLQSSYQDSFSWCNSLGEQRQQLQQLYHSTYTTEACRVLAQFSTAFIRHYLSTSHNDLGSVFVQQLKKYIGENANEKKVQKMLAMNIQTFAQSQHPYAEIIWPVLTKYLEGMIHTIFTRLSIAFAEIEAKDPDFLVDTAIDLLKDVTEYFKAVNRMTEEYQEDHSYRVPKIVMLVGFGELLHPGVPLNPELTEAERNQIRVKGCFGPTTKRIMNIAKIKMDELPFPSPIRGFLGRVVVDVIMPNVIMGCVNKLMDNNVRDQLTLNFVSMLYNTLNTISPNHHAEAPNEVKHPLTEKEMHLHETCGALVQELVKLVPDTLTQYVFKKEQVTRLSKQAIGAAVMDHLNKSTLMQIIDKVVWVGLPALHASKWEGKIGKEKLVPRKVRIGADGRMEISPATQFHFHFPKSAEELATASFKHSIETARNRKKLRDLFTQTISSQVTSKARIYLKNVWDNFQSSFNRVVERYTAPYGPQVKEYMDDICYTIFWEFFGSIIGFLSYPFVKFAIWAGECIYIDRKSEEIIECLHAETLDNLVYHMIDTFLVRCESAQLQDTNDKRQ